MEYICIGKIVNTHGLKGELRLLSSFEMKDKVFIPNQEIYIGKKLDKERINTFRHHKIFEMITLGGYNNINEVLKYKGLPVYIDKATLKLSDQEVLEEDLLGYTVIVNEIKHGNIIEVRTMQKGNKILVVNDNGKNVLIPYHPDFIIEINKKTNEIVVAFISGMFV